MSHKCNTNSNNFWVITYPESNIRISVDNRRQARIVKSILIAHYNRSNRRSKLWHYLTWQNKDIVLNCIIDAINRKIDNYIYI